MVEKRRTLALCAWAGAALLGALTLWQFLAFAWASLIFPASLNIGEGVVLHQAMFIPGPAMYGDIFRYPFMVFEYPPVYPLVVRAVALLGPDLLMAGRAVSLASTLFSCCVLAWLVRKCTPSGWAGAAIAAILPLGVLPVIVWVPLMRVDMLGLALSLLGLALVLESRTSRFLLAPAMIAFVAAVYTRQTDIAAPLAALGISLLRAPKPTLLAGAFGLALGLAVMAGFDAATAGGFFRHIVVYLGHNAFNLPVALSQIGWWILRYFAFWLLAAMGVACAWPRQTDWPALLARLRSQDDFAMLAVMAVYLLIATLMTPLIGKSGAWLNYMIEWMWVGAFWAGYACNAVVKTTRRPAMALAVPILLAVQMANGPISISAWRAASLTPARAAQNAMLVARLKQLPDPIMSDDMIALWQAGKDLGVESFMFAELARVGVLPESDLISLFAHKTFSAVVTDKGPGDQVFGTRYLPASQSALVANYPNVEALGDMMLRLPVRK